MEWEIQEREKAVRENGERREGNERKGGVGERRFGRKEGSEEREE